MNKNLVELAKELKKRDNPSIQGISIGRVETGLPDLRIRVNGILLDGSRLVVGKHLITTHQTSAVEVEDHGYHHHAISNVLESGDRVIVIPSTDNMTYFVIDKVGDIDVS